MATTKKIKSIIESSIEAKNLLCESKYLDIILKIAEEISSSLKRGGKLIVFGNGGSAADAQHMVCELVGRYKKERKAIAAISLTTNTSSITAISNDYSYDHSFKRQIEALGSKNDIALGISTSGNAPNVIEALKKAGELKVKTIALTGKDGGKICRAADISLIVPSEDTPRIQEAHILVIHILCELIEDALS
ncbi:MAG: D-sedoheptulose 7-phosphate isomerase [Candidatus Omnitrophica bacterium]|nr:D-sedoheptulose 7-phosphate isomerase [Candidatus Omnitrophota bacterium]